MKSVYLAGPISGTSYGECTDWRDIAIKVLSSAGIEAYSPMRGKQALSKETSIGDHYFDHSVMYTQQGIFARDYHDCRTCDAVFVNMIGTKTVSIGTVMEIAWAVAHNKALVLVMEDENNLHDHAMIREACPMRVNNFNEGIDLMKTILLPGGH